MARTFGFLAVAALGVATAAAGTKYRDDIPNVHITCHTHDDVGWLKTVDEYYMGANNSIQHAGVQYILDSVIPALEANPERKFNYVEQAFFTRWWQQQDASMQARVKALVKSGQLNFLNGGWAMHDEAGTHYVNMIEQTQRGHEFLMDAFAYAPTIGWQIDPFGHSSTQAALLSAEVGFDALYFGRIDYQDHDLRMNQSRMEMVWRASPSLGVDAQVYSGAFQSGNYGPPDGMCFDQFCSDPPIQNDPSLEDYNVANRVDKFVADVADHLKHAAPTNHIMFNMGSDFQYENANEWMKNLDRLIAATNAERPQRVNVFYSNPIEYTKAQNEAALTWTLKTDDFFPYRDCPHCPWTGYFTSRPALKRYVRHGSSYLHAVRQLDAVMGGNGSDTHYLWDSVSVASHHDAVAGTAKQHVAYDYARRISRGVAEASAAFASNLANLVAPSASTKPSFSQCTRLNVSVCDATQGADGDKLAVVFYNSEAKARTQLVRLPVQAEGYTVVDAAGKAVTAQSLATVTTAMNPMPYKAAPYTLAFQASAPPMGFATYFIQPASARTPAAAVARRAAAAATKAPRTTEVVENEKLALTFDATSGRLTGITNKASGVVIEAQHEFRYWNSSAGGKNGNQGWGNWGTQNSGAYIFRPNGTASFPVATGAVKMSITRGPAVTEVVQAWAPWLTSVIRLSPGDDDFELEWTVGPIPIDDRMGKEVVSIFTTNISSASTWYTDSNGRELVTRKLNYQPTYKLNVTEPVSDNFYPTNALVTIKDAHAQLSIAVDRSEGSASLHDGEVQVMVHRRILWDDGRGVGEPLNETQSITPYPNPKRIGTGLVVRGAHRVRLDAPASAAAGYRATMDRVFFEPTLAFAPLGGMTPAAWAAAYKTSFSSLKGPLPANAAVVSLMPRPDGVVLRLGHQFAVGEDTKLSQPVTIDLAGLFAAYSITNATELSLTANQPIGNIHRMTWKTADGERPNAEVAPAVARAVLSGGADPREVAAPRDRVAPNVTLQPMEIRTFLLDISSRAGKPWDGSSRMSHLA